MYHHSNNVLSFILTIVSVQYGGIFAIMQKDVRTDRDGACITNLLKYVPYQSFSASSTLRNDPEFGPHAVIMDAVYDLNKSNKAWCPDKQVSETPSEWLQVEFSSLKIIANIFTHGRDDGNYGEYVTNYYFDYQREDGLTWYRYRDGDRGEMIKGNNDARNPAQKKFDSPLVVKRLRILPINTTPRSVCLKITLYGCDFLDGVIEYRMPIGDTVSLSAVSIPFTDDRYDDLKYSNKTWLRGGLGKLMDNVIPSNSSSKNEMRRFFVVWDKAIQKKDHVDMIFRFDTVRRFRAVHLYPAVDSSMMILPLESVQIHLSKSESDVNHNTLSVKILQVPIDNHEPIVINLHEETAKYIRMSFFFKSTRMGFSELVFYSEPIGYVTVTSQPIKSIHQSANSSPNLITEGPSTEFSSQFIIPVTLIACFVGALVLVSGITIVSFLLLRYRRQRKRKSKLSDYRSIVIKDTAYPSCVGDIDTVSGNNSLYYGPVFGSNSSGTIGLRYIHPSYPPCQDYRAHSSNNSNDYEPIDYHWMNTSLQNATILKDKPTDLSSDRQRFLLPCANGIARNSTIIATSDCTTPFMRSDGTYSNIFTQDSLSHKFPSPDTFNNIYNIHVTKPLKGLIGSSVFSRRVMPTSDTWIECALSRLSEISARNIIIKGDLSQGDIGYIKSGIVDNYNVEIVVAELHKSQLDTEARHGFYRQCLLTVKEDFSSHPNMLPIIGLSRTDNVCTSIFYANPSHINVVTFFKKLRQIPKVNDSTTFTCNNISQSSLLYIAKQLSDALAFLDEAEVIHRDVSARNCSIGDRFHLILSDFAVGLKDFQDDYVCFLPPQLDLQDNARSVPSPLSLPLLWMPWEAIIMGNYSSKSDVWSFGVTLWEIFTECQVKPYPNLSSVYSQNPTIMIQNSIFLAGSHPSSILPNGRGLDQSLLSYDADSFSDIGKHVRSILTLCWQPNPLMRPNFQTLYSLINDIIPDLKYADDYGSLHRLIS